MKIIIMRGLPGAGKDHWIKNFIGDSYCEVFSADDFHMVNGVYNYDPKKAGLAHNRCFKYFFTAAFLQKKMDYLIVNNTNPTLVELAPYVRVAEVLEIDYTIKYIPCDPYIVYSRNTHKVPINTILSMHKNFLTEIVPPYWKQDVVL